MLTADLNPCIVMRLMRRTIYRCSWCGLNWTRELYLYTRRWRVHLCQRCLYCFIYFIFIVLWSMQLENMFMYFLSTLVSPKGVRYIFLLSCQEVWRVFHTHSFYRMQWKYIHMVMTPEFSLFSGSLRQIPDSQSE